MLFRSSKDVDWAIYIQGDEVLHEQDHERITASMSKWKNDRKVEGLLFKYHHFYGSYDYIGDTRRWYRNEIRIIRPHIGVVSYRDAQGFRLNNCKLKVKETGAYIYHYGWVKPPEKQAEKRQNFGKLWHSDAWVKKYRPEITFDYSEVESLAKFNGSHPLDRKSTRLNSSHSQQSRMPSSA